MNRSIIQRGGGWPLIPFNFTISHPVKIVDEHFKGINLDGNSVAVFPYPVNDIFRILTDTLMACDPDYGTNIFETSHVSVR